MKTFPAWIYRPIKISQNFVLQEVFGPWMILWYGAKALIFMDDRLITIAQALRDEFGPITINNWQTKGTRQYSGYRLFNAPVGAARSMHKHGKALDLIFHRTTAAQVRDHIRANQEKYYALGLRRVEDGVSWLHIDTANTDHMVKSGELKPGRIHFFKP